MAISRLSLLSFRPQVLKPFAALLVHAQLNAFAKVRAEGVRQFENADWQWLGFPSCGMRSPGIQ
jgi:hypothetical protein